MEWKVYIPMQLKERERKKKRIFFTWYQQERKLSSGRRQLREFYLAFWNKTKSSEHNKLSIVQFCKESNNNICSILELKSNNRMWPFFCVTKAAICKLRVHPRNYHRSAPVLADISYMKCQFQAPCNKLWIECVHNQKKK